MPKVPQLTPQIQSAPMPNIRVSEDISREAANIGSSAQTRDKTIYDIVEKAKLSADQVAVADAENELIKFENDFQYNPETGMYRKQGKDAFGLVEVSREEYAKKKSAISKDYLKNDVQRSAFNERATRREEQFNKETMNHVGVQIQKYDDETFTAGLKLNKDKAINGYQSPGAIPIALGDIKNSVLKYADRKGMSQDQAQLMIQNEESDIHSGVISRMLTNGDDISAQSYFDNNKQNIKNSKDLEQVEKQLEVGSTRGFSQRFADDMMKKGYDETQAYAAAKEIDNPRKREAAEQRLSYVYGLKRQAEQRRQEDVVNKLADYFDENGNIDDPKFTKAISSLDKASLSSLKEHIDKNPIRDDGVIYYQLRQMAEDPKTREKFKNYNLTKEFGNLNKENRNKLIQLQNDLRSGKSKTDKELDGSLSDSQIMQDVFNGAGYKNKEEFARFRQAVDSEILKTKQSTGKPHVNNDEVRDIANKLAKKKVVDDGIIWNSEKPLFEITVNDIPKKKLMQIEEALKARKKPINNKNIIDMFLLNNGNKLDE